MLYLRYHNTSCFFIKNKRGDQCLAVDAGWPCTLREYQRSMKDIGLRFGEISHCIVTHLHLDHAGLLGEFLECGIKCFLTEEQSFQRIDAMERTIRKNHPEYRAMDKSKLRMASLAGINAMLEDEGFPGEAIPTRGHSPDSLTFLAANGEAIIGDLAPLGQILDDAESEACWTMIRAKGARTIYPSHAGIFTLQD
jgi:glyoxylase-like metal-dependent hydrolase (beta-lactamase superfamily II)